MPSQYPTSARNQNEENGECAGNHAQSKHPSGNELPRRQTEQKEIQRLTKNRVYDTAASARCEPEEGECRPLRDHGAAGCSGNRERNTQRYEPQNGLNRQLHRLPADENGLTARQIRKVCSLESEKRSVQNEECCRRKSREDSPLKTQRFPEHVPKAERLEPE